LLIFLSIAVLILSMAKLGFTNSQEEVEIPDGEPIAQACEEAGVPFACTEGICGTCVVEVIEGMENLSPFTQEEKDFLGEQHKERLACQCKIRAGFVKLLF
jgi:ferredoxin